MFCGRPLCSRQVSLQCHQSSSSSPFLWLPSKSFSHRRGETKNGENLMIIVLIIVIIVVRQLTWQTLGATGNSPHPNNKTRELTDGRPSCLAENSSWQHLTCVSQVLLPLLSYWWENILAKESGKNGKWKIEKNHPGLAGTTFFAIETCRLWAITSKVFQSQFVGNRDETVGEPSDRQHSLAFVLRKTENPAWFRMR